MYTDLNEEEKKLRKFCIKQAVKVKNSEMNNVNHLAELFYVFMNTKTPVQDSHLKKELQEQE